MAKVKTVPTGLLLVVFLLVVATVFFAGLYFDAAKHVKQLDKEVQELKDSQVLLMVPDAQAEAIANWLASNPEQTKALLEHAQAGQQTSIQLDGDGRLSPLLPANGTPEQQSEQTINKEGANNQGKRDTQPVLDAELMSDGKDDVKVIRLPHGGIRVTTRKEN